MAALREALLSCRFASFSRNYKQNICNAVATAKNGYSSNSKNEENYDIVIAGGGMVGTSLACALANNKKLNGKRILLLEGSRKQDYTPQKEYSNRVIALNKQARILLASFGAWKLIKEVRCSPVQKMLVWDACSKAMIAFNEKYLTDELAYIVENDLLLHAVNKQVSEKENVTVIYESKVTDVKLSKTGYSTIELKSGKRFRSELLVGADGVNSLVRQAMAVQYLSWQYGQLGIVATLKLSEPTENITAWQKFLPTGPIALLPLTDSLSSLVWSVTNKEAQELLKLSNEEFVDRINDALWRVYPKNGIIESGMQVLGQLLKDLSLESGVSQHTPPFISTIVEGSRAAFPLNFGHAVSYAQPGVVLIGDAAHRVHPLAGQGLNLGFGDIVTLTWILAEANMNGSQLNNMQYLRRYETLRQQQNIPTMLVIDAFHRLYKTTAAPIVLARSLGMQLMNAIPQVKKFLIEQAAGKPI